jgi:tubulin monoglycylase TTLL3/8
MQPRRHTIYKKSLGSAPPRARVYKEGHPYDTEGKDKPLSLVKAIQMKVSSLAETLPKAQPAKLFVWNSSNRPDLTFSASPSYELRRSSKVTFVLPITPSSIPRTSIKTHSLDAWKRVYFIHPSKKVFSIHGSYPDIRAALLERGWVENSDEASCHFNLRWTKTSKVPADLKDWQLINHFANISEISTKKQLCENMRRLARWRIDPSAFFPRCFNLSDTANYSRFLDAFHFQAVTFTQTINLLKKLQSGQPTNPDQAKLALAICDRARKTGFTRVQPGEWKFLSVPGPAAALEATVVASAAKVLEQLRSLDPQFGMAGDRNIWIVKPGCKSRGRNIALFDSLEGIHRHIDREQSWVAQKYIERPLLIRSRKFDIRQWVLVTDMDPLTIWMYDECYLRFSAEDYDDQRLDNVYVHLTNNSIVKHSAHFHNSAFDGCMWSQDSFKAYLEATYDSRVWSDRILPRMQEAVTWSLAACSELIANRPKSFELLGYDFMLDADLQVWLIEVNTSPAMDYSTVGPT